MYSKASRIKAILFILSLDYFQITQAIYNAAPSSLVIMDEFGKGTSGEDGLILMAGVLRKFLRENDNCPHILVSTHYQRIAKYLPESPLLEYQKMSYTHNADEPMTFLYKLASGISESFAFDIAEEVGLNPRIIQRAREIFDALKNNTVIKPLNMNKNNTNKHYN